MPETKSKNKVIVILNCMYSYSCGVLIMVYSLGFF